ncbi:SPFH domain-containing protein [Poriferisphaera sp. WC338]|uniref:SPFH domain-containing protein n=1 Tax=Poriferisphaera sp. WC338 TaxID=3425129 RepID=UPI003D81B68D
MSNDQQTYKRAANAALFGLIAQVVLFLCVTMIGLAYESAAIMSAMWYILGGVPVWFILLVLFHQHKQERIESLEAEQLAEADAEAAAIFNEAGQQLAQARKRLASLNKWWIPGISLVLSVYLLSMGGYLFYKANSGIVRTAGEATDWSGLIGMGISPNAKPLVLVFLLGGLAFLGFLVARYVAGMTRVKEWQPLRGGASYVIGNVAVLVLLLFAGTVPVLVDPNYKWGFAVLSLAVPVVMIVLGLEIVLSFVFGIYRPRRAGEVNRAAFDSRILGWLTRPESLGSIISETLNYQFGFEISRSWFVELLNKSIVMLFAVAVILIVGLSTLVIVQPQQEAVILLNGKIVRTVEAGVWFKYPWPLGSAEKYDVNRVKRLVVGSVTESDREEVKPEMVQMLEQLNLNAGEKLGVWKHNHEPPVLWTNQHSRGMEEYMLIAATPVENQEDGEVTRGSVAGELAGVEMVVDYRTNNLMDYVTHVDRPDKMLKALAIKRLSAYVASRDIDTLIGEARVSGNTQLQSLLQDDVDAEKLGLEIVFVGFGSIHPPQGGEVAKAFHEQNGALQDMKIAVQSADKDSITLLAQVAGSRSKALEIKQSINELESLQLDEKPELAAAEQAKIEGLIDMAGGQAAQMLQEARAYRWQRALDEQSQARNFEAQLMAYRNAPTYYKYRMYWNTLAEGLKDKRKIVVDSDNIDETTLRFDMKETSSSLGSLFSGDQ